MHKVLSTAKNTLPLLLLLTASSGCASILGEPFRFSDHPAVDPIPIDSPVAEEMHRAPEPALPEAHVARPSPVKPEGEGLGAGAPDRDDSEDILHVLKPGETLSDLAKIYLGDSLKYRVIAKHNKLRNTHRVYAGRTIRIPRSAAVPILPTKTDPGGPETSSAPPAEPGRDKSETEALRTEEKKDSSAEESCAHRSRGIDLYETGRCEEALLQFGKALSMNPQDVVSADFFCKIHIEKGKSLLEEKDYMAASAHFRACLQHRPDYQECRDQAATSEALYKETHYRKGMQLFHEQRLIEAVEAWERVRAVDPKYKRVDSLIQKGKSMLRRMEEIKERQT